MAHPFFTMPFGMSNTNGTTPNDPLSHQSAQNYNYGILSGADDILNLLAFGDANASSNVMAELTGYASQQREFAQQEHLLDREQDWEIRGKMEAAKRAGINPNTAAAGIVGSGSPTAPAVSNATGAPAAGVSAAAQGISALAGGAASIADAVFKGKTLEPTIDKIKNEAAVEFEKIGLTAAERQIAEASAQYADENALRDIQNKRIGVKKLQQEYKNARSLHEKILQDIDTAMAQAELYGSQQDYYDQFTKKLEEETRWTKFTNDFYSSNGYDLNANGVHNIVAQMIGNDRDPEPFLDKWIEYNGRFTGVVSDAEQTAIQNHAFGIEFGRGKGKNAADELFGRIGSSADLAGRIAKMGTDLITNVVSDIGELFKSGKAKDIRVELNGILNNAYEQLDLFPQDAERLMPLINDIKGALMLSNKEIEEWYKKFNQ